MLYQYQKTTQELLDILNPRQKEVIERRFGLEDEEPETLEEIGQDYGVCRERIRQIQEQAILRLGKELEKHQRVFQYLKEEIENWGGLRREDKLLENLAKERFVNYVTFLLNLGQDFERRKEDEEFYTIWLTNRESLSFARKIINFLENFFEKEKTIFAFEEIFEFSKKRISVSPKFLNKSSFLSFLEATKKIEQGPTGQFGLSFWPEISPRGMKDRAYLVLKLEKKPSHFRDITRFINEFFFKKEKAVGKKALLQTVHNELIKDPRFVLVGRGIYALGEWGFQEGTVREIIFKILEEKKKPLTEKELLQEVSKQRLVKPNTILLNLADKTYFQKTPEGEYTLR